MRCAYCQDVKHLGFCSCDPDPYDKVYSVEDLKRDYGFTDEDIDQIRKYSALIDDEY